MNIVWRGRPLRYLTSNIVKSLGKSSGTIVCRHKERGSNYRVRLIDRFFLNSSPSVIRRLERVPRRNNVLALLVSGNGFSYYILAPEGAKVGDYIYSDYYYNSEFACLSATHGSYSKLRFVPIGFSVYSLQNCFGKAIFSRAGGSSSRIVSKDDRFALIKLPSGYYKNFLLDSKVQIGIPAISTHLNNKINLMKAGRSRYLGFRPHVRGVAMNPIDHPHGGGEGKSSGGRYSSLSPWARVTKGKKTVLKKNSIILN